MFKIKPMIMLMSGLFLFVLDRILKWNVMHSWNQTRLPAPWFGWHPFYNTGVAFGLPVPSFIVIALTLIILLIIAHHLFFSFKDFERHTARYLGFWLIFLGAISNLLDRLFFASTVDYILIWTAVINIADVLIVAGFIMYLISLKEEKRLHI